MFRESHAEHLRRQTKAIETIRGILAVWMTLTVIASSSSLPHPGSECHAFRAMALRDTLNGHP